MLFSHLLTTVLDLPSHYTNLSNEDLKDMEIFEQLCIDLDTIAEFLSMYEAYLIKNSPHTFKQVCKAKFLLKDAWLRARY